MRTLHPRFRDVPLRSIALLLAGAFIGAPFARLAHHATVGHAVCAEHGEIVHALGHDYESHGGGADRGAHALDDHERGVRESEDAAHDHHHCAVWAAWRERVLADHANASSAPAAAEARRLQTHARVRATSPVPLLRRAPKLPPPSPA